jgi:protein TonB
VGGIARTNANGYHFLNRPEPSRVPTRQPATRRSQPSQPAERTGFVREADCSVPFDIAACRRVALTAATALHAGAVLWLLGLTLPTAPPAPSQPIRVQWIEREPIDPPKALPPPPPKRAPQPPAPKPVLRVAQPEPPPLVAAAEAPSPQTPQLQPASPVEASPTPVAAAPESVAAPPAPSSVASVEAAAPAPLPVSPPSFDAAYLRNPPPSYPVQSRRLGEKGRVILRVLVTVTGAPERVELRTSSGSRRLDSAALEAVQRWQFVPARQGDAPVSAWVLVPILFSLEG